MINVRTLVPPPVTRLWLGSPALYSRVNAANIASYADRQLRFQSRYRRRYGDWSVLELPSVLLWVNSEPDYCCDDDDDL